MTPSVERAGARIVVVGNGPAWAIEGFREKSGFEGPIYTDPERKLYELLGLKRGLKTTVRWGALKQAIRAHKEGNRQTRTLGDPFQQGGTFVVSGDGAILWAYRSEFAGDHPPEDEVLAALGSP